MALLQRLKLFRRKYRVKKSVTNTLPSTETSMNGLTLILTTSEEQPLKSKQKLLKIFSMIARRMASHMKMMSSNFIVKLARCLLLTDMYMEHVLILNVHTMMPEEISVMGVES